MPLTGTRRNQHPTCIHEKRRRHSLKPLKPEVAYFAADLRRSSRLWSSDGQPGSNVAACGGAFG